MTERRLLAILGFLLALIGGILVVANAVTLPRGGTLDLESLGRRAVEAVLGIAAVLGGAYIYRGRMSTAGLATLVVGVVLIIVTTAVRLESVLILVGGVLGILGAEART